MPNNPLISIIIPTYNVESYIGRCLDSCINQTLGDIEIIVVDDCGSDNSIKIAKEYV
ncbi:glycosyltransferase family 2 protein, partial [Helicobacter japonicus]